MNAKRMCVFALVLVLSLCVVQAAMVTTDSSPRIYIDYTNESDRVTIVEAVISDGESTMDVLPYISGGMNYFVLQAPELENGGYTLQVTAKDEIGNVQEGHMSFPFIVDTTLEDVTIWTEPNDSIIMNTDTIDIYVHYLCDPEDIKLTIEWPGQSQIYYEDDLNEYVGMDRTWRKVNHYLPEDGDYRILAEGNCFHRPTVTGSYEFTLNYGPPVIELIRPFWGFVEDQGFEVLIHTSKPTQCRYEVDRWASWSSMEPFEPVNASEDNFSFYHRIPEYPHFSGINSTLYVLCNDSYGQMMNWPEEIKFWFDTSPPVINVSAIPSTIYMQPLETYVYILSDDPVRCRFDNDSNRVEWNELRYTTYGFENLSFSDYHYLKWSFDATETGINLMNTICENPLGKRSGLDTLAVDVNLDLPLDIKDETVRWTNKSYIKIGVSTNRVDADCYYSQNRDKIDNWMWDISDYYYSNVGSSWDDGDYTFYVQCDSPVNEKTITVRVGKDTSKPARPEVDDDTSLGNYTYSLKELSASFEAYDNESGIGKYRYAIFKGKGYGDTRITDWEETTSDHVTVKNLNLSNKTWYYFRAYSMNNAGLWSKPSYGRSDGVFTNTTMVPEICENGRFDVGMESGKDCGIECPPCELGLGCVDHDDCKSGLMCGASKTCIVSLCNDSIQGPEESDVDCGGPCSRCGEGKGCNADTDCLPGLQCSFEGICTVSISQICANGKLDPYYESDLDCGKRCALNEGKRCSGGERCESDQDCASNDCLSTKVCAGSSVGDGDLDGVSDDIDNCPGIRNPVDETGKQPDNDGDGMGDPCDDDDDNDGISDAVEEDHGLNPKLKGDANEDYDDDGLSNYEELVTYAQYDLIVSGEEGKDSDNDGYGDKEEIEAGTDPGDPKSKTKGGLWGILKILLIILLVIAILVLLYANREKLQDKFKKQKPRKPATPAQAVQQRVQPAKPVPPKAAGLTVVRTHDREEPTKLFKREGREDKMRAEKEKLMKEFDVGEKQAEPEPKKAPLKPLPKAPPKQDKPMLPEGDFQQLGKTLEEDISMPLAEILKQTKEIHGEEKVKEAKPEPKRTSAAKKKVQSKKTSSKKKTTSKKISSKKTSKGSSKKASKGSSKKTSNKTTTTSSSEKEVTIKHEGKDITVEVTVAPKKTKK